MVTYDDSDGWYDQVMSPILTQSQTSLDTLTGTGQCGTSTTKVPTNAAGQPEQARCGMGPRIPFMVISPYAKTNYVDNRIIDQSSIPAFIEDNWGLPRVGNGSTDALAGSITSMLDFSRPDMQPFYLDPITGEQVNGLPSDWSLFAGASSTNEAGDGQGPVRHVSARTVVTRTKRAVVTLYPEGSWWPEKLTAAQQGAPTGTPTGGAS